MAKEPDQLTTADETMLRDYLQGRLSEHEQEQVDQLIRRRPEVLARLKSLSNLNEADPFVKRLEEAAESQDRESNYGTHSQSEHSVDTSPSLDQQNRSFAGFPESSSEVIRELSEIKGYRIVSQIGAGGMGVVFKAENEEMGGRFEALKVLNNSLLQDPSALERFEREIHVAARLSGHQNIVTAHRVIRVKSLIVLVMEFVEGTDLNRHVKKRGPLNVDQSYRIARQVAAGLCHAHEFQMVHRDIKPANIMITTKGIAKILDFGLGKVQHAGRGASLTTGNMAMGTPHFMAPEQLSDAASVDIRADIYSLGCTLYFLLTGKPPIDGSIHQVYSTLIKGQKLPSIRTVRPDVPPAWSDIIDKMIAMAPDERFATPALLAKTLQDFKTGKNTAFESQSRNVDGPEDSLTQEHSGASPRKHPDSSSERAADTSSNRNRQTEPTLTQRLLPDEASSHAMPPMNHTSPAPGVPALARRATLWVGGGLAGLAMVVCLVGYVVYVGGFFVPSRQTSLANEFELYQEKVERGLGSVDFLNQHAGARLASWLELAQWGEPIAQLFVGRCYQEGVVVEKDFSVANQWLSKSADQGNSYAMLTLGLAYELEQGFQLDKAKVLSWYTKAAEAGNTVAMRNLGGCHEGGRFSKRAPELAYQWYRKAADLGDPVAMRFVSNCYKNGTGVEVDEEESSRWYSRALEHGDSYAIGRKLGFELSSSFDTWAKSRSSLDFKKLERLCQDFLDSDSKVKNTCIAQVTIWTELDKLDEDDPCRVLLERVRSDYLDVFSQLSHSQKQDSISTFAIASRPMMTKFHKALDDEAIVKFWEKHYFNIDLDTIGINTEFDSLVSQSNVYVNALIRRGDRDKALMFLKEVRGTCERRLKANPWDWYLKSSYEALCFATARSLREVSEEGEVRGLLRTGWTIKAERFGVVEMLARYPDLPLKGQLPKNCREEDKEFFAPPENPEKFRLTRFTVPCFFNEQEFPFHIYVVTGKKSYAGLQDQLRWLRERRGGKVATDILKSFERLNKIAVDNNVSYRDLVVYALGEAKKEDEESKE